MATSKGTVRLDERGRVVLPAGLRRELGLVPGDELVVTREAPGVLQLRSRRVAARALIGIAARSGRSAVAELRGLRAEQARAEQARAEQARAELASAEEARAADAPAATADAGGP